MKISVCMVVKNEAKMIERCLQSIKDAVHEIIILDTGSTDRTMEIAKRYTDKIHAYAPKLKSAGAGAEARNKAMEYASHEWIFVIDGDEVLDKGSVQELKQLTDSTETAFSIIQRNYTRNINTAGFKVAQKHGFPGYYDNRIARLFRKGIQFQSNVHETIDASVMDAGKNIKESGIILHHLRELKGIEKEKQLNYLEVYKEKLKKEPNDIDTHLGMAVIYQNQVKEYSKAQVHFLKVLALDPRNLNAYINFSYMLIMETGDLSSALTTLKTGLSHYPEDITLLNNLTVLYIKLHRISSAWKIAEKVLKKEPENISALMNTGYLNILGKDYEKALSIYDKILSISPGFKEAQANRDKLLGRFGPGKKRKTI